ncbi:MAG: hypothetical protein KDA42_11910 [Planctomycetales bacterium]|nr:hypothetical protein [Planctomycetales bacterium]
MWRALFLALGISSIILGAECLAVEKAILKSKEQAIGADYEDAPKGREITPPDWAPWSLMSGGVVVVLYSFTLPKRVKD